MNQELNNPKGTEPIVDIESKEEKKVESELIERLPLLEINSLSYQYSPKTSLVFDNFNLTITRKTNKGQIIVFLGPSGCGKSTLLRLIAGLNKPVSGNITVLGHQVFAPSGKRGVVFQNYTSFDWLTILENVAFPLKLKGIGKRDRTELASKYLSLVGLEDYKSYYPNQLSGGMKQRVAIARTMINEPDVLLMDEPFGALDHFTREDMQDNLLSLWTQMNNNIIFVTHDIVEAVYLADIIYIFSKIPDGLFMKHVISFPHQNRTKEIKYRPDFVRVVKIIQDQIREIVTKGNN